MADERVADVAAAIAPLVKEEPGEVQEERGEENNSVDFQFKIADVSQADHKTKRQCRNGWEAHARSIQQVEELTQRHPNVPFFVHFDKDTRVAFQSIATNSIKTAELILDVLSVHTSKGASSAAQVLLVDIIGAEGRKHLQCDAGRALVRLLNNDPPAEINLAAALQLPRVAAYFKAEHVLEDFFNECSLCTQDLSKDQALTVLHHALGGHEQILTIVGPRIHQIAVHLLGDVASEDALLALLKRLQPTVCDRQTVVTLLLLLQLARWTDPLPCALFTLGLARLASSSCGEGACAAVAQASGFFGCTDTTPASQADVVHRSVSHGLWVVRQLAQASGLPTGVAKLLLRACDIHADDACACKSAVLRAVTVPGALECSAPLLRLACAKVNTQATLYDHGDRVVVGAKMAWPKTGDAFGSAASHAYGLATAATVCTPAGQDFQLGIYEAAEGVRFKTCIGCRHPKVKTSSLRHCILAAMPQSDLASLQTPLVMWSVTGCAAADLKHWSVHPWRDGPSLGCELLTPLEPVSNHLKLPNGQPINPGKYFLLVMLIEVPSK